MTNFLDIVQQNPSVISALAALFALFVSFISIILTIVTLWMQRVHNLKSVTPIANFSLSNYENDVAVQIINQGTGPLIVRSLTVTQPNGPPAKNIISLMPDLPDKLDWVTFFENTENFAITPTNSITLIQLSGDETDEEFCAARDMVRRRLSELQMTLEYQDIYGRLMPQNTKDMKWFSKYL